MLTSIFQAHKMRNMIINNILNIVSTATCFNAAASSSGSP